MHEGLVEFALLLQDGRQIRVGGGEFGEDVERLQIEARRFLDEALLALYVGQIVERVGVCGTQAKRRRVTILGILIIRQTDKVNQKKTFQLNKVKRKNT